MNDQSIENLTPQQLRRAAAIKERIQSLVKELKKLLAVKSAVPGPALKTAKRKRKMSAAAKARLSKAAKARWAKAKAAGKTRL